MDYKLHYQPGDMVLVYYREDQEKRDLGIITHVADSGVDVMCFGSGAIRFHKGLWHTEDPRNYNEHGEMHIDAWKRGLFAPTIRTQQLMKLSTQVPGFDNRLRIVERALQSPLSTPRDPQAAGMLPAKAPRRISTLPPEEVERAATWLVTRLSSGPAKMVPLRDEAAKLGHMKLALQEAARTLGVVEYRPGYGAPVHWRLPEDDMSIEDLLPANRGEDADDGNGPEDESESEEEGSQVPQATEA